MLLNGTYVVGPEGAAVTWADGSERAFPPGAHVTFGPSDLPMPRRVQGRLTRLTAAGSTYEAPERLPQR